MELPVPLWGSPASSAAFLITWGIKSSRSLGHRLVGRGGGIHCSAPWIRARPGPFCSVETGKLSPLFCLYRTDEAWAAHTSATSFTLDVHVYMLAGGGTARWRPTVNPRVNQAPGLQGCPPRPVDPIHHPSPAKPLFRHLQARSRLAARADGGHRPSFSRWAPSCPSRLGRALDGCGLSTLLPVPSWPSGRR